MKKFFFSFLILNSSLASAGHLQCKAHLVTEDREDILAKDRARMELVGGQANLFRTIQSKDLGITYTYQVLVENGKIISLGIQTPQSSSHNRYLSGQEQVMMNAASALDGSLLVVNCQIF